MEVYGSRIKALRIAENLTQEEFGKKVGTTGVTIMRYEKGQREPRFQQLNKMADALSISINFFLSAPPFEDLEFLQLFKPMILSILEQHGLVDLTGREYTKSISDSEYWHLISDNIVGIVQVDKHKLDIQFKDPKIGEESILSVANKGNIDFNSLIYGLDDDHEIQLACHILKCFVELNPLGQMKLNDRLMELMEIKKYLR